MIWSGEPGWGGFTWALYPVDENHTRLVSRIRWSHNWRKPGQLSLDLLTEFTDHLAVRKILQGVKGRAEGRIEPMTPANMEFASYLAFALTFLGAIVLILVRPLTWRRWLAGLTAGAAWLITWYAPVSKWIAVFPAIRERPRPKRMLRKDEGCKQAAVLVAVWTCPVCFATEGQFDGYVAVGFGPDDVDQLVAGCISKSAA